MDELLYTTRERVYVDDTAALGHGQRLLYPVGAVIPVEEARRLGLLKDEQHAHGERVEQDGNVIGRQQPRTTKVQRPKS